MLHFAKNLFVTILANMTDTIVLALLMQSEGNILNNSKIIAKQCTNSNA